MATPPSSMEAPCTDLKLSVAADDNEDELKRSRIMRAQWLRAAILGANDGLLSTTSLMLGVGAAKEDRGLMIISGVAGAVAGACSMAVGEFVSVATQRDIERTTLIDKTDATSKIRRQESATNVSSGGSTFSPAGSPFMKVVVAVDSRVREEEEEEEMMPNPYKAAFASGLAFLCGSGFPILTALVFSKHRRIMIVGMVVVTTLALLIFGAAGARVGGSPVRASAMRVLIGGWISMAITYGLLKPLDKDQD